MTRLESIRIDFEKWKVNHPTMAYSVATDDVEYLLQIAAAYETAKFCKCP
jgi:hypothetical protein